MATTKIWELVEPAELFSLDKDGVPHPTYLRLDCVTGAVSCFAFYGAARPEAVVTELTLWWRIPCFTAAAANTAMTQLEPTLQTILDGFRIGPTGHGEFTETAQEACAVVERICDPDCWSGRDLVGWITADEWISTEGEEQFVERVGLTADTMEHDLVEILRSERKNVQGMGEYGFYVLLGFEEALTRLQQTLRSQLADDLVELTARMRDLKTDQARLVRRLSAQGLVSRDIAPLVNRSHFWVQQHIPGRAIVVQVAGVLASGAPWKRDSTFTRSTGEDGFTARDVPMVVLTYTDSPPSLELQLFGDDPEVFYRSASTAAAFVPTGVMVYAPQVVDGVPAGGVPVG